MRNDLPRAYRERVLDAAVKAEVAEDPAARRKLIEAAANWTRMAEYEEKHPSDSLTGTADTKLRRRQMATGRSGPALEAAQGLTRPIDGGTMAAMGMPQAQMWRLSADRRTIRLQLPPLRLAGMKEPVDIHLDFEAEAVDEMLQRLTELRRRCCHRRFGSELHALRDDL